MDTIPPATAPPVEERLSRPMRNPITARIMPITATGMATTPTNGIQQPKHAKIPRTRAAVPIPFEDL
jgi:hypothetical protein